jgi:hypothetical protein
MVATWLSSTALAAPAVPTEDDDVCAHDQSVITVVGELHRQRRPRSDGAPYLRHQQGDILILRLKKPLCVVLPDDVSLAPRPRRIQEIQLLSDEPLPRSPERYRRFDGTLMLDREGLFRLPVLLKVRANEAGDRAARNER